MYGEYTIPNCPITTFARKVVVSEIHAVSDKMVLNCIVTRYNFQNEPINAVGLTSGFVQLVAVDDENVTEFTDFKNAILSGNANVPAILQSVITNADSNGRFN